MRLAILLNPIRQRPGSPRIAGLSPATRVALAKAAKLAEATGSDLVALAVAPQEAADYLHRLEGAGVSIAYRCWFDQEETEELAQNPVAVGEFLAAAAAHLQCDVLFAGASSGCFQTGITPIAVARALGIPHISEVDTLALDGDEGAMRVLGHRGNAKAEFELEPPALLTFTARAAHSYGDPLLEPCENPDRKFVRSLTPQDVGFDADDPLPWPVPTSRPATPAAPRALGSSEALIQCLRDLGTLR